MNGRVYDPLVGRMISADPTVPDPMNAQAWNRYSYVGNDPLAFTDPSGYSWLSSFFHSVGNFFKSVFNAIPILRSIVQIVVTVVLTPIIGPIAAAGASAAIVTGLSGGKLGDMLKAAAFAAATTAVFVGIKEAAGISSDAYAEAVTNARATQGATSETNLLSMNAFAMADATELPGITVTAPRMGATFIPGLSEAFGPSAWMLEDALAPCVIASISGSPCGLFGRGGFIGGGGRGGGGGGRGGTSTEFYRGAKPGEAPSFVPRTNEYKVDRTTGRVKDGYGVSVFDNVNSVTSRGFEAYRVDQSSIPDSLRIIQRGNDIHHFEIVPRPGVDLTPRQFIDACSGILCVK